MTEDFDREDREVEQRHLQLMRAMKTEHWRMIMQTGGGREVIYDVLAAAQVFGEPFTGEAMWTAFNCGKASLGRMILAAVMEADEQMYLLMMREANERAGHEQQRQWDREQRRNRYESGNRPGDDDPPVDPGNPRD